MKHQSPADRARMRAHVRQTRLELLRRVVAYDCGKRGCTRAACRRTGRCRDLDWVERTIARPLAAAGDPPPDALDRALVTALRQALNGTGKPA